MNLEVSSFIFRITISIPAIKISYIFVHISYCVHTDEVFLLYSHLQVKCCHFQVHIEKLSPIALQWYCQSKAEIKQRKGAANWRRDRIPGNCCACKSVSWKAASSLFPGKWSPSSFCGSFLPTRLRSLYVVKHVSHEKRKIKASPQRKVNSGYHVPLICITNV